MGKIWDIRPPRQRAKTQAPTKIRKRSSNRGTFFFGMVVLIFLGIFFLETSKNPSQNINGQATAKPPASSTAPTPAATPTKKETNAPLIKLLNGSGRSEETVSIKELVTDAGFAVSKTENALNIYEGTIVYYEPGREKEAQEIAKTLVKYQPKLQPFSQDAPYDIIVVIGTK